MDNTIAIELSTKTLFACFLLPFAYYGYSAKLWYAPDRIRLLNFINAATSVVCILYSLFYLTQLLKSGMYSDTDLAVLHLGPPFLTLFAIARGKNLGLPGAIRAITSETAYAPELEPAPVTPDKVEEISWDNLIIPDKVKKELLSVIDLLRNPEAASKYGITIPRGILFNGPPGTGKTTIARVVAHTAGLSFFALQSDQIVSKWVGESEKNLTRLFEAASSLAPAVIFIDEIDSIGKKRSEKNAAHADNLLNHLLQLIDGVIQTKGIYIIGATNRAELVDDALKRAGRLNRVITIELPDYDARHKIFARYTRSLALDADVQIEMLAQVTEGASPAEIKEICNQAGLQAFQRESRVGNSRSSMSRTFTVSADDFQAALERLEPGQEENEALPRPDNQRVEELGWDDLIIDQSLKTELQSIVEMLKDSDAAKRYGIDTPKGILLKGPPGTGKTTIAKVIASTAGMSFFAFQLNDIVSKWVGDSEKNLSQLFESAAKHAPSVIFIDEIDSVAKNRAEGNAQHSDMLLNHLLQLIDGVIKRDGVYVIAATNRAELVDPALLRGGRLGRAVEVGLPGFEARKRIFDCYLSKMQLGTKPDLALLARAMEGRSPADIKGVCNQAGLNAFRRESGKPTKEYKVTPGDLDSAVTEYLSTHRAVATPLRKTA